MLLNIAREKIASNEVIEDEKKVTFVQAGAKVGPDQLGLHAHFRLK